jgi:cytochrome P450
MDINSFGSHLQGHDTTAAAINWSLFLIGGNPEVQVSL